MSVANCTLAATGTRWTELTADPKLAAWDFKSDVAAWQVAGDATLDGKKRKSLIAQPGTGAIVSPHGKIPDLKTKQSYADLDVHVEFMIPRGSNSGVKLMGLYEIQIYDSKGVAHLSGDACGGIYPRGEMEPKYHVIDEGTPPKMNAAKAAGQWQTLDIEFVAPRFDTSGQKLSNAKFVKVVLNGHLIHKNVEVAYPTGKAWRLKREVAKGPLLLQGDHGPVAFRNVRVRDTGNPAN
ncbi:MAG: DUF1080 domain-containing protein [Pirellulales bacterium]